MRILKSKGLEPLEEVHYGTGPEAKKVELDIWIPNHKLAIEYQGTSRFVRELNYQESITTTISKAFMGPSVEYLCVTTETD